MKLSKVIVILAMALALLFVANVASAQAPVWTDILNQLWYGNMASGSYFQVGPSPQPSTIWYTDLAGIQPTPNTLSLAVSTLTGDGTQDGTGQDPQSGSDSCGTVISPVTFIESGQGTGVKGVGFKGNFNAPMGGVSLTYYPDQNLFEAVFFHEDYCYGLASDGRSSDGSTSREYGFFLSGYGGGIYAYWGTHENQRGQEVQAQFQLPNVQPGMEYYFEMYPAWSGGSCGFYVTVLDTNFNPVYPTTFTSVDSYNYPTPGPTITGADSGFCSSVAAAGGDTGYVSANISVAPAVTGTLPSTSELNTYLERVFVGK
ncbi:MAG TPA: hypothetical protein VI685_01930 [Candidatus Angelobacter sp.]